MVTWELICGKEKGISFDCFFHLTSTFIFYCRWNEEFEANHVLVMTAQVFVDVINHAFFSINQLNLLVFDECHAAVKDSPMRQILLKLHNSGMTKCNSWHLHIMNCVKLNN